MARAAKYEEMPAHKGIVQHTTISVELTCLTT